MIVKKVVGQYVTPYLIWFKVALLVALFSLGWVTSCTHYKNASSQVTTETAAEIATLRTANAEYARVDEARNERALAELAASEVLVAEAQKAAGRQQARAETLADTLRRLEEKQRDAALDPKCRDIMELEVCPALQ